MAKPEEVPNRGRFADMYPEHWSVEDNVIEAACVEAEQNDGFCINPSRVHALALEHGLPEDTARKLMMSCFHVFDVRFFDLDGNCLSTQEGARVLWSALQDEKSPEAHQTYISYVLKEEARTR